MKVKSKQQNRTRRQARVRAKISGTQSRPRLSVFKSNMKIYAQLIDDDMGVTLAQASGKVAREVGTEMAKLALTKNINTVVFDRGGYLYTGKTKELAEGARNGGLKF